MDKIPVIIIVVIILAAAGFWAWQAGFFVKNNPLPPAAPPGILLFFGADCPHCKNVDDFIKENKIAEKVNFTNLEIPFNGKTSPELEANAQLAVKLAQYCKIDLSRGLSIPFMWDGSKCYVGQDDVINFFKNKAGIQ